MAESTEAVNAQHPAAHPGECAQYSVDRRPQEVCAEGHCSLFIDKNSKQPKIPSQVEWTPGFSKVVGKGVTVPPHPQPSMPPNDSTLCQEGVGGRGACGP